MEKIAAEFDADQEVIDWQRRLIIRAKQGRDAAYLRGLWIFNEPPDEAQITAVRRAAEAWDDLLHYLESIKNLTPDELAEQRADAKSKEAKNKTDSRESRRHEQFEVAV